MFMLKKLAHLALSIYLQLAIVFCIMSNLPLLKSMIVTAQIAFCLSNLEYWKSVAILNAQWDHINTHRINISKGEGEKNNKCDLLYQIKRMRFKNLQAACKLRWLDQLRPKFRLESDSNNLLINFFNLILLSKSESLLNLIVFQLNSTFCINLTFSIF